jgi:hypothetical protein
MRGQAGWIIALALFGCAAAAQAQEDRALFAMQGEILEVEELKAPRGNAILTVKDLSSGETHRFLADSSRTVVQLGSALASVPDVLAGSKASFVYRKPAEGTETLPLITFLKASSSYYT